MKHLDSQPDSLMSALWSVFPTVGDFQSFHNDKRHMAIVGQFIDLAYQNGLIPQKSESEFEGLVHRCSEIFKDRKPASEYTFELLVKEIKKEKSIKRLVTDLRALAKKFGFMEPDEVLFTRLKKDFHTNSARKHHALMLLALWLGMYKPDLGLNFKTLLGFPRNLSDITEDEKTGIVASFAFVGESIDAAITEFLKREMTICVRDLNINYLNEKRIHYLATMCTAKFPLKEGAAGFPASYAEAIRDALSLSYQMIVTWQLSPLYTANVHLIIALDGGLFELLDNSMKELLHPELPFDHPIRMSHFVFTAASQAEAKITYKRLHYPNFWAVENFWAFPYFKSPPALMPAEKATKDGIEYLPVKKDGLRVFRDALFSGDTKDMPLLALIHQYPPKMLLILEIADILTLRRLHHEAIQLLSNVLSLDPLNYIARSMRLHNFLLLANVAKDLETADALYERGIYEGDFLESHCVAEAELYGEICILYWSRAMKLIKHLRRGEITDRVPENQAKIFEYIDKATHYAKKGLAGSRSGLDNRSAFWWLYCAGFKRLLEDNPQLMTDRKVAFVDEKGLYYDAAKPLFNSIGWLMFNGENAVFDENYVDQRMAAAMDTYLKSLSKTSFYVNVLLSICALIWDFSRPAKKKRMIDQVLLLLGIALRKTEELKKSCLGIYSVTLAYPVIQSPEEFIVCVKRAQNALEEIKRTGNYKTGLKLGLMHFDDEVGSEPITFDLIQAEENKRKR